MCTTDVQGRERRRPRPQDWRRLGPSPRVTVVVAERAGERSLPPPAPCRTELAITPQGHHNGKDIRRHLHRVIHTRSVGLDGQSRNLRLTQIRQRQRQGSPPLRHVRTLPRIPLGADRPDRGTRRQPLGHSPGLEVVTARHRGGVSLRPARATVEYRKPPPTKEKPVTDPVRSTHQLSDQDFGAFVQEADYYFFPSLTGNKHLLRVDRKSKRLNSSHVVISYAGCCVQKKIE